MISAGLSGKVSTCAPGYMVLLAGNVRSGDRTAVACPGTTRPRSGWRRRCPVERLLWQWTIAESEPSFVSCATFSEGRGAGRRAGSALCWHKAVPTARETTDIRPADPLATPWSRAFGLRVPVVNAPMGGVAGGALAAAVTAAGGLGMIGMGSAATPEALRREI